MFILIVPSDQRYNATNQISCGPQDKSLNHLHLIHTAHVYNALPVIIPRIA